MGAALVLLLVGLGAMAAGVLIGRYYVPDDRQLRRTARHSRAYMRALSHLIARDHDTVVAELRNVVEENIDDVEPYFALGAMFRSRGEHERAIRVHQALALRERDRRKLRQRAMYELGLDFRAAGMPRRATRAMEEVLLEDPSHEGALRVLAALYEEQARFNEAAGLWQRLGRRRGEDTSHREHHLLVAAAQAALGRDDLDSAKQLLKAAQKLEESAHFLVAAAELAAARGNHRGARERLKQALIAEPGLALHVLPGLIGAEQGLAERGGAVEKIRQDRDDLDDDAQGETWQLTAERAPLLSAGSSVQRPAASPPLLAAVAASSSSSSAIEPLAGAVEVTSAASSAAVVAPIPAPASRPPVSGAMQAATGGTIETKETPSPPPRLPGNETKDARAEPIDAGPPRSKDQNLVASGIAGTPSLAVLAEVEAQTGPRLELALIRAQLVPPADDTARAQLASELAAAFPDSLAARVAAARLALTSDDQATLRRVLGGLVSDDGALAWALRGRWQCAHCGSRPRAFSWRCGQCRRWSTLRMETGVEPPPLPPRERRAQPRSQRSEGLLGAAPEDGLPAATLDPGLSDLELATAGRRRSLLGRVGGWVSGVWRRDAS